MPAAHLTDRRPEIGADELITALVPPRRFGGVRFSTYVPNPDEPSQPAAVTACSAFAVRVDAAAAKKPKSKLRAMFGREAVDPHEPMGLYLDGGFGVGKTHLLASTWHAGPSPKAYGTFVEITNLVGVLGFGDAVRRLSGHRFLAIDEFELDDPGDTTLVSRLLGELMAAGVFVAATSNTLPDKLGEGRFAAEDFLREIQALSKRFTVVRMDGPDYRHRGLPDAPPPVSAEELEASAEEHEGATVDDFDALCEHLAGLHPSRYGRLLDGVSMVHVRDVHAAPDQSVALRLVAFADRLYDSAIPVVASGEPLPALFTEEMVNGGYRKKYLRSISRLTALARDAAKAAK
jgi:cell division protein ZapE